MPTTIPRMGRKKTHQPLPPEGTPTKPSKMPSRDKTDVVRIEADLAHMATMIAIRRGINVAELLSPILRKVIEAEYRAEVKEMDAEIEQRRAEGGGGQRAGHGRTPKNFPRGRGQGPR